ncbi:UPF0052 protein yjiF [Lacticaseibacillus paracasei subsp. paracasei CNCM I-4648]|nr:UPF0052 protein yjiF [Lacticaseibacillus paracasei subsp. paracasei CNCM I-4648]
MSRETKFIRVIRGRRPKVVVIGGGTGLPVTFCIVCMSKMQM